MRTVGNQSEPPRRARMEYEKDRHYVLAQKADQNWDAEPLDALLDEVLPDGTPAYREECNGSDEGVARQITKSRKNVLLSCPKWYFDEKQKRISNESKGRATAVAKETDTSFEKLETQSAISFSDMPNKEDIDKRAGIS